jgi:hypothetical protein
VYARRPLLVHAGVTRVAHARDVATRVYEAPAEHPELAGVARGIVVADDARLAPLTEHVVTDELDLVALEVVGERAGRHAVGHGVAGGARVEEQLTARGPADSGRGSGGEGDQYEGGGANEENGGGRARACRRYCCTGCSLRVHRFYGPHPTRSPSSVSVVTRLATPVTATIRGSLP